MHDLPAWNWKKQTIFPQDFVDEFVFHTLWYAIITSDDISSLGKDTAIIEEIIEFSFVEWMMWGKSSYDFTISSLMSQEKQEIYSNSCTTKSK